MNKEFVMSLEDAGYRNCWVAYFDILGFKKIFTDATSQLNAPNVLFVIRKNYEEVLSNLNARAMKSIHFAWFSDTFIIFSQDDSVQSFENIRLLAEKFFIKCTGNGIPIRGSLSFGLFSFDKALKERIYLGNALIDSYTFAEDSDWIGFILTPYAIKKACGFKFYPERHEYRATYKYGNRDKKIPMKKLRTERVVAFAPCYRESHPLYPNRHPLTPVLISMQRNAPAKERHKYERTINFFDYWHTERAKKLELRNN